jgi:hypothetical protein
VRTRSRLEHQRLVNLCVPSRRGLQVKRSFCPVVYPRKSPFESVGMSPRQCGMTFLLDIWCLWALFAMPVGPACCLQATRKGSLVRFNDRKPGALLVCNDRWLRNTAVCKPVPYCSQAATPIGRFNASRIEGTARHRKCSQSGSRAVGDTSSRGRKTS